jgi:cytochrome c
VAADSGSENRGQIQFETFCTPCHGQKGEGMGKVVQKGFLPPPMLTSSHTRGLSDGWIYSYIRHGGVVMMPPYGFGVRPKEAWDLVNYVRKLQRENPTP